MSAITRWNQRKTATIASAGTTSGAVEVGEFEHGSVQFPAALTGTTVTVHTSNDGTTYTAALDAAGSAIAAMTFAAGKVHPLHADLFKARFIKLVSNGTEGAARNLILHLRG